MARTLRLAVAQSTVPEDPTDRGALRAAGQEIRALMTEAAAAGAQLVQFPEGAITYPSKHVMAAGPDGKLVPADWSRAAWDVLREEAESIAALAGELRLWTAFGSLHPLTPPNRPHNSLFVVSDHGDLVARYDKRFLSHTEVSYLYTPGREPLVFEVDGIRIGCALCVEANFPPLFAEYERLDVDLVLLSVMVDDAPSVGSHFSCRNLTADVGSGSDPTSVVRFAGRHGALVWCAASGWTPDRSAARNSTCRAV